MTASEQFIDSVSRKEICGVILAWHHAWKGIEKVRPRYVAE